MFGGCSRSQCYCIRRWYLQLEYRFGCCIPQKTWVPHLCWTRILNRTPQAFFKLAVAYESRSSLAFCRMMRLRSPGGVTQCIHPAGKLHLAISLLDHSSAVPRIVSLTTSANRWLSSLNTLVQEIRQKDALCLTQDDAKRKTETEAVILTLTY